MNTGDRIRITHPQLSPGRTGAIHGVNESAGIHGEPLYTIRLDQSGWPGAANAPENSSSDFRWVDLRRNEFEVT